MAIQVINIGTSPNKGDGEPLRTAFDKINDNFSELSLKVTNLETGGVTVTTGDIKGSVFGDDSTLLVDGINSRIPSSVLHCTAGNRWFSIDRNQFNYIRWTECKLLSRL